MREIDEAFDGHSAGQTDRFCTYDEDPGNLDQYDPHSSDDSEIELAIDDNDDFDDYGESFDLKTLEEEGDPVDPIGNAVNLASIKAAFEALAGEKPSESGKEMNLPIIPAAEERSYVSSVSSKKYQGPPSNLGGGLFVLPLYAMLPAAQLRAFEKVREGERLVVVATNVAETSLTIPGIKCVVDTGREKVKKYNSHNGMETYEVQWIRRQLLNEQEEQEELDLATVIVFILLLSSIMFFPNFQWLKYLKYLLRESSFFYEIHGH
ncbi:hypothetical protein Scep_021429 [Stephania cephalantha]|uniref:Helicase C-terminal domain-containing protein n=1 Tax=Stephania cephalantha TaxID=152367 RepID=A0AAP0F614_9MAGN